VSAVFAFAGLLVVLLIAVAVYGCLGAIVFVEVRGWWRRRRVRRLLQSVVVLPEYRDPSNVRRIYPTRGDGAA